MSTTSPILEVAKSYVIENAPDATPQAISASVKALDKLLNGMISYEECSKRVNDMIGTQKPVDKIYEILSVDSKPLPDDSDDEDDEPKKSRRKRARPWLQCEDIRLLAGIYRFGLDNWDEVVKFVGNNRTKPQCSQRWYRGIDPKINKSAWTPDEDKKLLNLVDEFGPRAWARISSLMQTRSDVQCRYHYFQISKKAKKIKATKNDCEDYKPSKPIQNTYKPPETRHTSSSKSPAQSEESTDEKFESPIHIPTIQCVTDLDPFSAIPSLGFGSIFDDPFFDYL